MKWKYSHCIATCNCIEDFPRKVNFTTLTPLNNKSCKEDDDMINKVGYILKNIGFEFWSCSVMLINHQHIEKSDIIEYLNEHSISSERII